LYYKCVCYFIISITCGGTHFKKTALAAAGFDFFTTVLLKIQFFVDPEDRDKTTLRNLGKYLYVDAAKYLRRHGYTTAHTMSPEHSV
jgi:hypothetical protein